MNARKHPTGAGISTPTLRRIAPPNKIRALTCFRLKPLSDDLPVCKPCLARAPIGWLLEHKQQLRDAAAHEQDARGFTRELSHAILRLDCDHEERKR